MTVVSAQIVFYKDSLNGLMEGRRRFLSPFLLGYLRFLGALTLDRRGGRSPSSGIDSHLRGLIPSLETKTRSVGF